MKLRHWLLTALLVPALALANGEVISPNMNLVVPAVGLTTGPQWAADLNISLNLIDAHDHSPGNGVQITPAGMNISSDLSFNSHSCTSTKSVVFASNGSPLSTNGAVYESGVDLYYTDGNGNQIRLTQSGAIAGTPGAISNLSAPASAAYVAANQTFVWQSNVNTPANMDGASYILRNLSANSKGLTLAPPAAMASNFTLVLPSVPAATSLISVDPSGNMLANFSPQALNPAGSIIAYTASTAPAGWLLCDGTSYLQSTYSALFAVIGTAYGTADSTHFNVPDLRGTFIRMMDGSAGIDPDAATRTAAVAGTFTVGGGATTNGSSAITVTSTALLSPGMTATGTGLPANSVVRSITDATHFVLGNLANSANVNATSTNASQTYTFSKSSLGNYLGSIQADQFKSHSHTVYGPNQQLAAGGLNVYGLDNGSTNSNGVTAATGGNESRPKNTSINYIIKY